VGDRAGGATGSLLSLRKRAQTQERKGDASVRLFTNRFEWHAPADEGGLRASSATKIECVAELGAADDDDGSCLIFALAAERLRHQASEDGSCGG